MENFPNYAGYGQSPTVCVNHPDRVSYTQCGRCGRIICGECQTAQDAGIVCPDCYRELTGGRSKAKGSFLARHWHITYTIILINVVVYGLQQIIPFRWVYNLGMMSGPRVHHGEYYRLITHGFVHSQNDPMHMVWNMIYLFIFGVSLERMSLFHPNISHAGHFGGLVSGALATLLIIPFVKKPESSNPPP